MTGPRMGPRAAGRLTVAISRPRFRPWAACISIVAISGIITPPPSPCRARKAISDGAFHASAHSVDPSRKTVSATSHSRLLPSRPCSHPLIGMLTNIASR